jgi:hypothetical protein
MPTRKKRKPHFEVPEELDKPKAGWVYRSEAAAPPPPPRAEPIGPDASSSTSRSSERGEPFFLMSVGARALGYSLAAAGQMFLLGTRIIVLPFRVAERILSR